MILKAWLLIFGSCSCQNQACGVSEIGPQWSGSLFAFLQNNHLDSQTHWHCSTENLLTSPSWCLLLAKVAMWLPPWSCMVEWSYMVHAATARTGSVWCSYQQPHPPPALSRATSPQHPFPLTKPYWVVSAFNENKQENVDKQHLDLLIATFTVSRQEENYFEHKSIKPS